MNDIPLVRTNNVDDINTSLIAVKKTIGEKGDIREVNVDVSVHTDAVDEVTPGEMSPVTSNAVSVALSAESINRNSAIANAMSNVKYLIPIRTTFATTNYTDYVYYKQLGNNFSTYFNNLPEISGKTKKVRLLFNVYTQSSNAITIGLRRRDDTDYYVVLEQSVWGGISEENFSNLYWVGIDPSYLNSYTIIGFKTNNSSYQVGIEYCFAEVYYE